MTDFYARLEEQLMTAARQRAQQGAIRRAVAGRHPQLVAGLTAVAIVVAGVTFLPGALAPTDSTSPAPPPSSRPAAPPAAAGDLSGIRLAVFNGSTRPGLARRYGARLQARGAVITALGNYHHQRSDAVNLVRYRRGAAALARRVAAALDVPRVTRATAADAAIARDADVVVVVGVRDRPASNAGG